MAIVPLRSMTLRFQNLPARFHGLRVVHLSDLHATSWTPVFASVHKQLSALAADLIVITGDLGHCLRYAPLSAQLIRRLLNGVRPRLGIFGVLGNHDDPVIADLVAGTVRILHNQSVALGDPPQRLHLVGLAGPLDTSIDVPSALWNVPRGEFTIVLSHYPNAAFVLPPGFVNLILAGHTHGSQLRLPGLGPLLPRIAGLPRKYCSGFSTVNGATMYVTTGVGTSGILPYRLFCRPEIALLELVADSHGKA